MILFPNAKINIGLNVTERRPDGYHNLETIFYPIDVKDVIEVVEANELSLHTSGLEIPGRADDNLCLKAYGLLKRDHNSIPPVAIHIHKHIPIGAGLGGGSADAAFFVKLMDAKFELGLDESAIETYVRQLGADCAFFVRNKPVFAYGIGDQFKPISVNLDEYYLVLAMPDVHISTSEAYRGVKPAKPSKVLTELVQLPVEQWKYHIKNDFETSVFNNNPTVRGVKAAMYAAGAVYASMSGSGASVYGIFDKPLALPQLEAYCKVFYGV